MTQDSLDASLKRIDSKLSCVFDGMKMCYKIIGVDARSQTYLLYSIPLGQLDYYGPQVLEGVRKARFFTAKEKNKMIDEAEEREEKQHERTIEDELDHATAEGYDVLKRLEGQRITLPDCGFEFHDKRRVSPENNSSS